MSQQIRLALVGPAGSGKDYVYNYLKDRFYTERIAFADQLKMEFGDVLRFLLGPVDVTEDTITWINQRKQLPAVRAYLQAAGEVCCALGGEEFWADMAMGYLDSLDDDDQPEIIIVTDCRKLPEAEACRAKGFQIVRLVRMDNHQADGITQETARHRSETEMALIQPDYTLVNPGTPEFHNAIDQMLEHFAS